MIKSAVSVVAACLFGALTAFGQVPPPAGIPVTDQLTRNRCVSCHAADDQGRMTRISFMRKTPEGWQETIRRMVRENGVTIEPAEARAIVKYLSNNHGLAPEEAEPAFYEAERRVVREKVPEDLQAACIKCHSLGRIMGQRRTRPEWELLTNFHQAVYPLTEQQAFRVVRDPNAPLRFVPAIDEVTRPSDNVRPGPIPVSPPEPARGSNDNQKDPVDRALDYLGRTLPLETPEWHAWRANFRQPRLEGTWAVSVYVPGKGRGFGQMVIERGAAGDEFQTRTTIDFAGGERTTRTGRVILYAGYSWRGSSNDPQPRTAYLKDLREVLFLSRDLATMTGRFFTGAYDELGMDVALQRVGRDTVVLGTDRSRLIAGKTAAVKVYGSNFPTDLRIEDIDFGPGVSATRVQESAAGLTVDLEVAANAAVGYRDLLIRGRLSRRVLAVFDRIDYIRVLPEQGMSRVGGVRFPKQFQQFDAVAYHNGPDKRQGTADDIELGPAPVTWAVDEFPATLSDDDQRYVGAIDGNGFFTPNIDGPNPERSGNRNNLGDVRVTATYSGEGVTRPIRGTALLIVTVPLYARWQQLEILP